MSEKRFFVFDVESIGLHGEGFAVGGGIYLENGAALSEFRFCCPVENATGDFDDLKWVLANVPVMESTHREPKQVRDAFWGEWVRAKAAGCIMAADCNWPVEARFLAQCIADEKLSRKWDGPYPFIDIGSVLLANGVDPLSVFDRTPSEMPKHDPLADARQSARILTEALSSRSKTVPYALALELFDHMHKMGFADLVFNNPKCNPELAARFHELMKQMDAHH